MKRLVIAIAIALLLTGCAAQQIDHILSNLDKDCERHYSGSVGGIAGIGAQGNFTIDCKASGTTITTTTTVVPANPASGAIPSGN